MLAILFFLVLGLYVLACIYIAREVSRACQTTAGKNTSRIVIGVMSVLFFAERLLSGHLPEGAMRLLYFLSTTWLVVIMYGTIILLFFKTIKAITKRIKGLDKPTTIYEIYNYIAILIIILFTGMMNANLPSLTKYEVHSQHYNGEPIKIAFLSDLHMGYAIRTDDIAKAVKTINSLNPDLCIIGGDLFDGDTAPVLNNDIGSPLRELQSKYGTFAVLGNHEYIGNADIAASYLRGLGITILRDSATQAGNVWLIGRDDKSVERFNRRRKDLSLLANDTLPQIVIDHQPISNAESCAIGAALQLSGHTHAGQVWPMKLFTSLIFENDYGHTTHHNDTTGSTDIIVTSGYGTWGPRIRLGNQPEIVEITLTGVK